MFSPNRTCVLLGLILYIAPCKSSAQSVQYLPTIDFDSRTDEKLQLLGVMDSHFYLFHAVPGVMSELLILDEAGQLIRSRTLPFIIPGRTAGLNIVLHDSTINIVVQEVVDQKHYVLCQTLNATGDFQGNIRCLDSTDLHQYGNNAFYRVTISPNKKHLLLHRIVAGFSTIQILFNGILLNEKGEKTHGNFFYLAFNGEMETVGNIFVTNEGKLILPVHDKHDNFKLGCTLRLYYSSLSNQAPTLLDFYLKENKPEELLMDWDENRNRLVLAGLYHNFYSKNIEGAMTLFINPEKKTLDTIVYFTFDKAIKKGLRNRTTGIPAKDVFNSLRIRYFDINQNDQVSLLADLFTNSALYGRVGPTLISNPNPSNPGRVSGLRSQPAFGYNATERDVSNLGASASTAPVTPRVFNNDRNNTVNNLNPLSNTTRIGGTGGRPVTIDGNFSRNQSSVLNASPTNTRTPTVFDASDLAASNRSLNYKSVFFTTDSGLARPRISWERQFFVPGTVFANIILQPSVGGLGVINYELNQKNNPLLTRHQFTNNGTVNQMSLGSTTDPPLFYKGNSVLGVNNQVLSLYVDPETYKVGIAIIK